jgi:outer membrane protein OmpA-like peptidoglycan-associated protein
VSKLSKSALAIGIASSVAFLGGCATNPQTGQIGLAPSITNGYNSLFNDPDPCASNDLHAGAVLGALGGGVLGYLEHRDAKGILVGAVAGAAVGGLIGHQLDSRRCEIYKIAQANHLHVMSAKITPQSLGESASTGEGGKSADIGLNVQLQNNANEFVPGTAELTPASRAYLSEIAKLYAPTALEASLPSNATPEQRAQVLGRKVLIVGHTDEKDSASGVDLARLSQARARAVAQVFAANGVPARNINYQGAGATLPLASNATEEGRKDNARVQIVDVPTEQALKQYVTHRKANPSDFARVPAASVPVADSDVKAIASNVVASSSSAPKTKSSVVKHEKPTEVASASKYGFDGTPLEGNYRIDLGAAPSSASTFSFISSANADTPVVVNSCLGDHPRESTDIKNLATGQTLVTNDAIPGLYGQPWMGTQGQSSVALLHVYAPKDAAAPVPPVTVEFYKDENGKMSKHPLHIAKDSPVNVYRGTNATLYRVFVHGPAQCIDLYVPNHSASGHGLVIYPDAGREYKSSGQYKSLG